MNAHMRRYLEEDWDEEQDEARETRERKSGKSQSQLSQARRQAGKEFGKAIAKMHREKAKFEGANRKP